MAITPLEAAAGLAARSDCPLVVANGAPGAGCASGLHPEERRFLDEAPRIVAARARQVVLFGEAGPVVGAALGRARLPEDGAGRRARGCGAAAAAGARPGDDILLAPIFFVEPAEADRFGRLVMEALER